MKNINQHIENAKKTYREEPLFSMEEIENICGSSPSLNIGTIKKTANFFRRSIMKILSIVAAGALITALYLMNMDTDAQDMQQSIAASNVPTQQTVVNNKQHHTGNQSNDNRISAPDIDPDDLQNPDDNLFASISGGIGDLFSSKDEITPEKQSNLMGYPIFVLSKEEAEKIGFVYDDDEIVFRHKARIVLPYENDFITREQYNGASKNLLDKMDKKGYDINKDSILYEEIRIYPGEDDPARTIIMEKDKAKKISFSDINPIDMSHFKIINTFTENYSNIMGVTLSPPYQLSKYMADDYEGKLSLFEVKRIATGQLFENYTHFYVDTSFKSAEVFKKFVKIIIPIENDDATVFLDSWFLLNQELASKLPQRYQGDIKYKYQITESDYFTDMSKKIAVFIEKGSQLPWTKISFVPNHFPIYGVEPNGEYRKISTGDLTKLTSYLSTKLSKNILKEVSNNSKKSLYILNKIPNKTNEIKLLITLLQKDKTKATNINAVELDAKELSKLGVSKSKNAIKYTIEHINEIDKLTIREYSYQFDNDDIRGIEADGHPLSGGTGDEYFSLSYNNKVQNKEIHNFNRIMPVAFSLNNEFTFFNSPSIYYSRDQLIKKLRKEQKTEFYIAKRISANTKIPIYVNDGDDFELIGSKPENYVPYLAMLDRLIPVKIETGFAKVPGPLYLWFLPTTEFLNALPERYSKSLRKELAILDKIENQNVPAEKACTGFEEESFLGICDLSEGALSDIKIAPNPCMYDLKLSFTSSEKRSVSMEVFDINGRNVKIFGEFKIENFGEQTYTFDISSLQTGIYQLVIISDKGEKISKRFIKQ